MAASREPFSLRNAPFHKKSSFVLVDFLYVVLL